MVDKVTDNLVKVCSDMNIIMRDTMNASLQSFTILTKGYEEMCDTVSSLVQRSLENNAQASRALMGAKTPHDLMDTQSSLLKNGFDGAMIEMNRLMQMSSRLAQQAAEPVTQNMNSAIVRFSQNRVA